MGFLGISGPIMIPPQILISPHRMFFFHIQALVCSIQCMVAILLTSIQYNTASLIFSWFALANLWLTFSIIIDLTLRQKIKVFGTDEIVSAILD